MPDVQLRSFIQGNMSDPLDGIRRSMFVIQDGPNEHRLEITMTDVDYRNGPSFSAKGWSQMRHHLEALVSGAFRLGQESC